MARLLAVAALVLSAAPAAQAKAPPDLRLCGASGCVAIASAAAEQLPLWHTDGAVAPGSPAAFYVFRYRWRTTDAYETAYWVPSQNVLRFATPYLAAWYRVSSPSLMPFAAGVTPFAKPRISSVTVGTRHVRAPTTYLRLLAVGRATNVFPAVGWLSVRFDAGASNPWTDARANVRLSRTGSYLLRDDTVFVIPKRIADRARRGLALA
jgi:hypothetical protein